MRNPLQLLALLSAFSVTAQAELSTRGWIDLATLIETERDQPDALLRLGTLENPVDTEGYLKPRVDRSQLLLFGAVGGELTLHRAFRISAQADTGVIDPFADTPTSNGRTIEEEAQETAFLRGLWLDLGPVAWMTLSAGKRRAQLGGGLIFDGIATGAELSVSPDGHVGWQDLSLRLGVWYPGRDLRADAGVVVHSELSYSPDLISRIWLFAAQAKDDGVTSVDLVRAAFDASVAASGDRAVLNTLLGACADVHARFSPEWYGAGAELYDGPHRLRGRLAIGRGDGNAGFDRSLEGFCAEVWGADTEVRATHRSVVLRSHALDFEYRVRLSPKFYPQLGLAVLSGNADELTDGRFGAFIAIAPRMRRPRLLFDSGYGASLNTQGATAAGFAAKGIRAASVGALFVPERSIEVELWLSATAADQPTPFGSSTAYGGAVDFELNWAISDSHRLLVEVSAIELGGFFPERGRWWRSTLAWMAGWP